MKKNKVEEEEAEEEMDELHHENEELHEQVEKLQKENSEMKAKLTSVSYDSEKLGGLKVRLLRILICFTTDALLTHSYCMISFHT